MSATKIEKEVRFAVVMYGGGSLAIYINGIAQELLKMVRSSAKDRSVDEAFDGTEKVYRQIALLLSDEKLLEDFAGLDEPEQIELELNRLVRSGDDKASQRSAEKHVIPNFDEPTVRFVIDVITGSSAGGINGVFLAKALANNQEIERLKQLWLDEGDFNKLLNDKYSITNEVRQLKKPTEPVSLLNSQRMYFKLLAALDTMSGDNSSDESEQTQLSPNAEELDLFVTVTDFAGVPVRIRLFDRVVTERRHKQYFHFKYGKRQANGDLSQFTKKYNPFLAFAARSTSAFPLAFEPMRLFDIDEVINRCFPQYKNVNTDWTGFFEEFRLPPHLPPNVRYFVDGGALDNKPFGFAIDTLLRREADVPIDRKLIYIEPSPDFPDLNEGAGEKPDALQNLIGQGASLPRYETIREDLQVLLERNRIVERVNRLVKFVERDADQLYEKTAESGSEWEDKDFKYFAEKGKVSYLPYYRLRLISLTDNLAHSITQFFGFDVKSDYFLAIRSLIRYWRENEFLDNKPDNAASGSVKTAFYFLRRFDIDYRIRRLRFMLRKADQLRQCKDWEPKLKDSLRERHRIIHDNCDNPRLQQIIRDIQKHLAKILQDFRAAQEALNSFRYSQKQPITLNGSRFASDLTDAFRGKLEITIEHLEIILGQRNINNQTIADEFNEEIGVKRAGEFFNQNNAAYEWLKTLGGALEGYLVNAVFEPLGNQIKSILTPTGNADQILDDEVRKYFQHYYAQFDEYDQMTFPIYYETQIGEADPVEIVRISPHDASSLIEELSGEEKRRKLAGNALYGFGAFLDVRWRQNDIAWGRLDGAERIVTSLLPTGSRYRLLRETLIRKAHEDIFKEEFVSKNRDELNRQVVKALLDVKAYGEKEKFDKTIERITNNLIQSNVLKANLGSVFQNSLTDSAGVYAAVKKGYEIDRSLEPREALRLVSRTTKIVGKILEQIAEKNARAGSRLAWISRLGAIFWGLIEVAVPHSFLNLLFRYWLKLLYFFEAVLIIGGVLLGNPDVQRFGLLALLVTIALNLTMLLLHDSMRGGGAWKKTIFVVLFIFGVIFGLMGFFLFLALFFVEGFWMAISDFHDAVLNLPTGYKILPGLILGALILLALIWSAIRQYQIESRFRKG